MPLAATAEVSIAGQPGASRDLPPLRARFARAFVRTARMHIRVCVSPRLARAALIAACAWALSPGNAVAAGPATHFVVTGAPTVVTAGIGFSFTVTALDATNATATGYMGTVHFVSSDGQAVLPADYTFLATDAGVKTFSATLRTAGTWNINATDTATSSITGTTSSITVVPAAATHFGVSAPPSVAAQTPFMLTVRALDQFNNTATSFTDTVHFNSSDSLATLPADYTFALIDAGVHTFSATLGTAGPQTITAIDTANPPINGSATIQVLTATHFTISAPGSATAGIAFGFIVTALDASNQVATNYRGTVHFVSSDGQAVLPADYTFAAGDAGVKTFSATLRTASSQFIMATDTANASINGTSLPITVSPAAATHFAVSGPANVVPRIAFTFTVTALDQFNNTATGYGGTVHFISSDGQATLPANSTLTSGTGAFSATLRAAGPQTITATDTTTASITGTSNTIVVYGATHDFNFDHMSDILWRNNNGGGVAMWLMNGATIASPLGVGSVPNDWQIAGQRDFNADGFADILWNDSNGGVALWFMNGATFTSVVLVGFLPNGWSIVGTGDFNNDGISDILLRHTSGGVGIWFMNGNGTMASAVGVGSVPSEWMVAGAGDFNADGVWDILWYNTNSGGIAMWLMNSNGTVKSAVGVGSLPVSTWSIAGTGDFNGDGISDILFHSNSGGGVALWLMNSNGTVKSAVGVGSLPVSTWSIAGTGDFNGDGISDILFHSNSGGVALWLMNSNGTIMSPIGVGSVTTDWQIQSTNAD